MGWGLTEEEGCGEVRRVRHSPHRPNLRGDKHLAIQINKEVDFFAVTLVGRPAGQ